MSVVQKEPHPNAFVRAFNWLLRKRKAKPSHWNKYIEGFLSHGHSDPAKVRKMLIREFNLKELPAVPMERSKSAMALYQRLTAGTDPSRPASREEKIRIDKASRDAEIVASIEAHRTAQDSIREAAACVLVSSSGRLREFSEIGNDVGETLVISPSTWTYMVSMVPGVRA